MKKSLKKQIKQDEFVTGYERARSWMSSHMDEVRATVVGIVILAAVVGGLFYFRADRQRSAARAFGEALDIFDAPVNADSSNDTGSPSSAAFETKEEKYRRSLAAFDGIVSRHGSLPIGRRARYYAALCRIELGHLDDAAKDLEEVAKAKGVEASLARLGLAELERRRGDMERAIDVYQRLLDEPESPLPRDHVLMRLASAFEDAGRTDEAAEAFRRVTLENPLSVYSNEAERRAEFLRIDGNRG